MPIGATALELSIPAVSALLGVLVGGLVPHLLSRRSDAQARYDTALAAITRMQAARYGVGVNVPAQFIKATGIEQRQIEQDLSVEAVRRFLTATADARAALAALHPYSPDLRPYWERDTEISPTELDDLTAILMKRRRRPTKQHASS